MRGECSIPLRNFIDGGLGESVAQNCAKLNVIWVLGFCLVVSIILIAINIGQRDREKRGDPGPKPLYLPLWLTLLPIFYFLWYYFTAETSSRDLLETEKLLFTESGMKKSDFLNFRAGEDRAKFSSLVAASGALFIGSTALFGPFLRGDR
jgi:hypothetical protein